MAQSARNSSAEELWIEFPKSALYGQRKTHAQKAYPETTNDPVLQAMDDLLQETIAVVV